MNSPDPSATSGASGAASYMKIITVVFIISGAAALIYQVLWMRHLSLFFGSDVFAAAITLSVFMGGLSIGSFASGAFGARVRGPLIIYGAIEILIAIFALFFRDILFGLEDTYRIIYRSSFETDPFLYQGFRIVAATLTLLAPTLLMGATLPLIIRQFANRMNELGRRAGYFYAANTLGALIGTFLAGFIMLPLIGIQASTLVTASANGLIGVTAILIGVALIGRGENRTSEAETGTEAASEAPGASSSSARAAAVAIFISGLAALALEVVWVRILVQSFSATVYAFTIMLCCFLAGIYWGSIKAARSIDDDEAPLLQFIRLELFLAGSVALLPVFIFFAPSLFGALTWGLTTVLQGNFAFASIAAQFIVAGIFIIIPTTLLGATFPVAVKSFTGNIQRRAHGTGSIYAANTAGAIIGALLGGFVLLPTFGSRWSLEVIALLFLSAAIYMGWSNRKTMARMIGPRHIAVPGVMIAAGVGAALFLPVQIVANYNLQNNTAPESIYHGEGVAHTIDIVRSAKGHTIMMVNGNIEADTSLIQRRHFILKAHLPTLLHGDAKKIGVVGLGLGVTTAALLRNPMVENVHVIELSPKMVEAHRLNPELTGGILDNQKLTLTIDDGRNFMTMTDAKFDVITADPIHPRITGVGYLYTREYYEQLKSRLKPGGLVLQWMPMYNIAKSSFDVALRTFAKTFPNASFWYVRGHGLMVGTQGPLHLDFKKFAKGFELPKIRKDFASIGMTSPEAVLGHLLMDATHIRAYLDAGGEAIINTDDNAYLETRTPFEFLGRTRDLVEAIKPLSGWNMPEIMKGASPMARELVQGAYSQRLKRLLTELDTRIQ